MSAKKTSIGGQALLEGIMMRGPKVTAMAVRNPEGEIILEEHPTRGTERAKFFKLPIIRGVFNMVDSLAAGYKYLMRSAEISGVDAEEEKRKAENPKWYDAPIVDKLLMPIATVLAVVLAVVLFFWLPMQLFTWLSAAVPALDGHYLLRAVFEGVLRILIFIGYVWATSLMKDIRRTYQYHGAEHEDDLLLRGGPAADGGKRARTAPVPSPLRHVVSDSGAAGEHRGFDVHPHRQRPIAHVRQAPDAAAHHRHRL